MLSFSELMNNNDTWFVDIRRHDTVLFKEPYFDVPSGISLDDFLASNSGLFHDRETFQEFVSGMFYLQASNYFETITEAETGSNSFEIKKIDLVTFGSALSKEELSVRLLNDKDFLNSLSFVFSFDGQEETYHVAYADVSEDFLLEGIMKEIVFL